MKSFQVVYREFIADGFSEVCLYGEKSINSWDVTMYATQRHCITSVFYFIILQ